MPQVNRHLLTSLQAKSCNVIGEQKLTTKDELGRNGCVVPRDDAGACSWNRPMWGQNVHGTILTCLPFHVARDRKPPWCTGGCVLSGTSDRPCSRHQPIWDYSVLTRTDRKARVTALGQSIKLENQFHSRREYSPVPCLRLNPARQCKAAPLRWTGWEGCKSPMIAVPQDQKSRYLMENNQSYFMLVSP